MPTRQHISPLQAARKKYKVKLPKALRHGANVEIKEGKPTHSISDKKKIEKLFKKTYGLPILKFTDTPLKKDHHTIKVGVVLSGGQAPGGHNVIAGLFDGLKSLNSKNKLYGFLGGPGGLLDNQYIEITDELIDEYRNTGGFDIIGSGRTKLETEEQFDIAAENCKALGINGIIIVGGDDSNTNACLLAEYYASNNVPIQVIGCPKTIDGDLKNEQIECSFGFDTACKVYSELIGNIQKDANSAKKYWHFIKLMGRSASHITLECALQTHPNITLIGEEVADKKRTLRDIINSMVKIIIDRSEKGYNYGVVLVPEGLIEFIPEMRVLIDELNETIANHTDALAEFSGEQEKVDYLTGKLSAVSAKVYLSLPRDIRRQLIMDRDPHGNVQVSRIETEKLLIELLEDRLRELKSEGAYSGRFSALNHFFGYEGRCAAPSNFDSNYCYSLGYTASALVAAKKTGYMASVRNLSSSIDDWIAGGVPITMMMNIERRHGEDKPVIQKALVKLDAGPYLEYLSHKSKWGKKNSYLYPGPIQYFGPSEVCDVANKTLELEIEMYKDN